MVQKKKDLSKIIPVLIAALVCDVAAIDPSTRKKSLIGIFDRITVGKFPTKRPVSVYMKVTDAEGDYELEMRYIQCYTGKQLAGANGALHSDDKLASIDMVIHFPPLPFPEEGRYEFQIWANDMFLGSTFIDAVSRK
jgi:hypothetical protein